MRGVEHTRCVIRHDNLDGFLGMGGGILPALHRRFHERRAITFVGVLELASERIEAVLQRRDALVLIFEHDELLGL